MPKVAQIWIFPALNAAWAAVGSRYCTFTSLYFSPASVRTLASRYSAMLPRAEETTTVLPLRSATVFTGESLRVMIAVPEPLEVAAATSLIFRPPLMAWRVGRSAAVPVSTFPLCIAWNSGAAPWNSAHLTL